MNPLTYLDQILQLANYHPVPLNIPRLPYSLPHPLIRLGIQDRFEHAEEVRLDGAAGRGRFERGYDIEISLGEDGGGWMHMWVRGREKE